MYQAIDNEPGELALHLQETVNRLAVLAVNASLNSAEQKTEKLKQYVVLPALCAKWYIYTSPSRILQEEMEKLEDLSRKSLAIRTVHTFIFI